MTKEDRQRYEKEFSDYWESLDHSPHDHLGDRTEAEVWYIKGRAATETLLN